MSGIRISEFKKPSTIIVEQAKVSSAYGPKSSILLEKLASSYSKSGFTIEVQGLSRDSLLNGLFVSIPLQVRWVAKDAGVKLLVNQYPQLAGVGPVLGPVLPRSSCNLPQNMVPGPKSTFWTMSHDFLSTFYHLKGVPFQPFFIWGHFLDTFGW